MIERSIPEDPQELADRWNERYRGRPSVPDPALVLREWAHLVPRRGMALDLACGLGGNALWLAGCGLRVAAWDLSAVAVAALGEAAGRLAVAVEAEVRDLIAAPPPAASFDLICVAHFLDRGLAPQIAAALRPGGLLFYQTFTREGQTDRGPTSPAYRLAPNELLDLFRGLIVRGYREEGRLAAPGSDLGDLALMVAQRP